MDYGTKLFTLVLIVFRPVARFQCFPSISKLKIKILSEILQLKDDNMFPCFYTRQQTTRLHLFFFCLQNSHTKEDTAKMRQFFMGKHSLF